MFTWFQQYVVMMLVAYLDASFQECDLNIFFRIGLYVKRSPQNLGFNSCGFDKEGVLGIFAYFKISFSFQIHFTLCLSFEGIRIFQ